MTLLDTHLEQMELCSSTIADLPFQPPKMFTNALLRSHDITALIRDTEAHERALFSLASPTDLPSARDQNDNPARQSTIFSIDGNPRNTTGFFQVPRKNTAVAAVLGGDMAGRLRRESARAAQDSQRREGKHKGEIDVGLLLDGAEKLCGIYPIAGSAERIVTLRARHSEVMASIEKYEELVAEQAAQLRSMNRPTSYVTNDEDDEMEHRKALHVERLPLTQQELKREEEGIKELELKKRSLEERVSGMEKDLGGLLR